MKLELLRKTDQALKALRYLESSPQRRQTDEIAAVIDASPQYVPQVMAPLVRNGWVVSVRGPGGGYEVIADMADVTMRQLIEAVEGPVQDGMCVLRPAPCPGSDECALHQPWARAREALIRELDAIPVGDGRS